MSYPKWVDFGVGVGPVLCLNEAEEAAVHALRAARAQPGDTFDVDGVTHVVTETIVTAEPVKNKGGRPRKVQ